MNDKRGTMNGKRQWTQPNAKKATVERQRMESERRADAKGYFERFSSKVSSA